MTSQKHTLAMRHVTRAAFLTLALSSPVWSQTAPSADEPVKLSGPRLGVTFLSDSIVRKIRDDDDIDIGSVITQFGWQFEKRFSTGENGPTLVTEWVVLVGGVEQGLFIPSVSWLLGIRTRNGVEFGVGPNVTPLGAALVVAAGVTFRAGDLNVPVNLAVVPSKIRYDSFSNNPPYFTQVQDSGVRVSLLFGFNARR